MSTEPKVTAKFLFDKLRVEGVMLLDEVRDAGGHHASRSLDGMSFGLWPSKGSHATGYEIKVSRADWLKELSQIEKAEAFRPFCKYFFLVSAKKVAEAHEIPETWGWLEWDGRRLVCMKQAPANADLKPFPPSMLSAILKRCLDRSYEWARRDITKEFEDRKANLQKEIDNAVAKATVDDKHMVNVAKEFFQKLGITRAFHSHHDVMTFMRNEKAMAFLKEFLATNNDKGWQSKLTYYAEHLINRLNDVVEQREKVQAVLQKLKEHEEIA